jgi:tungstate transport system substrate-binding protein
LPVVRLIVALLVAVVAGCAPVPIATLTPSPAPATAQPTPIPRSASAKEVILATTTSTQDSGLLDVLVPRFEQQTGYQVKTVSVGTGAALALGARGEADVVLVHAPASEVQWMSQGNGTTIFSLSDRRAIQLGSQERPQLWRR